MLEAASGRDRPHSIRVLARPVLVTSSPRRFPMVHRVYVGNLPFTCSPEDLKQIFAAHGPTGSSIVTDRETGRWRGFGFVDFASTESMLVAIQAMNGHLVNGRPLTVSEARERQPGDRPSSGAGTGGPRRSFGAPVPGSARPASEVRRPASGSSFAPAGGSGQPRPRAGERKPREQRERGDRWSDGGGKPRRKRDFEDDGEEGF